MEDEGEVFDQWRVTRLLEKECLRGEGCCLVAYQGQRAVGVVVGLQVYEPSHQYEIYSLYVNRENRGQGIAEQLIEGLSEWITDDEATISITTVGTARPFYRSLGFEETCRVNTVGVRTAREALRGGR